ncbi:dolichol-phosphate mannosyltransferase [Cryobacterium sp. MP_3.1]|uniref:Dolichol-phosphate mannosyltransferase n=1 Tax=Cryobacterium zongtaii TaxID=1259217 RepID=A0A2S3ZM98_9MICO|nr:MULTISPECIES: polyprenol monophosphomannose synthase [Cryobacterium]MEC5183154.1 dolichol-phosphate mannosyltransferase [Cryobacterium sp. MP_3.1]POH69703.1 dolichol-phosphate mannosyltransferase [Cryobacterium zongtaii]
MRTSEAARGAGSLVIIPTYNEFENLEKIVSRLLTATPAAHVLIVDDGSPDGTGALADRMAEADDRIKVEHRTGKLGLGSAYVLGFMWGLARGYEFLIEMDADGSHPPERLPDMIGRVASDEPGAPDLAVGSRWVPGGSVVNWPRHRQLLSRGGNTYARLVLGLSLKDVTAGFRVYSSATIAAMDLAAVSSKGYCFQVDMTLRVLDQGRSVVELPIEFREREAGESKMSQAIVIEAMLRVTQWGFQRRFTKIRSGRAQATVR